MSNLDSDTMQVGNTIRGASERASTTLESYEELVSQGKSETLSRVGTFDICYMKLEGICSSAEKCNGDYINCQGGYVERRQGK